MFSLRLNERRGGCMSRKIHFYILIFFEVLLALSMLRSYGLHFEYETLNSVSLLSSQLPHLPNLARHYDEEDRTSDALSLL